VFAESANLVGFRVFWGPSPQAPGRRGFAPRTPLVGVGSGVCGRLLALQPSALQPSLLTPFAAFSLRSSRSSRSSPPSPLRPPTLHALRPSPFLLPPPSASALCHLRRPFAGLRPFHLSPPFGRTPLPAPRPSHLALRTSPSALHALRASAFVPLRLTPSFFGALVTRASHRLAFVGCGWGGVSWWGVGGWGIGRCWLCRSCLLFRLVVLVGLVLLLFCLLLCLRCLLWIVGCLLCLLLLRLLGWCLLLSLFRRLVLCLGLSFVVGWRIWLALLLGRLHCLFVGRRLVLLLVGLGLLLFVVVLP